jgi:hypothetical protein
MEENGNASGSRTRSSSYAKSTQTWAGRQSMSRGFSPVIADDVRVAAYGRDDDGACIAAGRGHGRALGAAAVVRTLRWVQTRSAGKEDQREEHIVRQKTPEW